MVCSLPWYLARLSEVLAVERGEVDAVGLVGDQQVEHRPDEGEAAGLAGEAAHHLGAPADLAERSFEQVRNRYERVQMPPRPATGSLQLLSASGSVSTVRPSGSRGIRERTQAGQAGVVRCALSAS